jgi:CubicO group peptidase (beta-lactamase class C family)
MILLSLNQVAAGGSLLSPQRGTPARPKHKAFRRAFVEHYGRTGYAGTYFWIDSQEQVILILMSQEPVRCRHYRIQLRDLVIPGTDRITDARIEGSLRFR